MVIELFYLLLNINCMNYFTHKQPVFHFLTVLFFFAQMQRHLLFKMKWDENNGHAVNIFLPYSYCGKNGYDVIMQPWL